MLIAALTVSCATWDTRASFFDTEGGFHDKKLVQAAPGAAYFLRVEAVTGLTQVDEKTGLRELADMKLDQGRQEAAPPGG